METLRKHFNKVVWAVILIGGFLFYQSQPVTTQKVGGDTMLWVGGTTYNLSGAGVSSSATSITLSSLTIPQTGQKLVDADFANTFYLTIDPGNRTRQEFASCTTVTQNSAGTATLSGCSRGLSPISPYTASTTLQFAHAGGAQVIFSNSPQFYDQFPAKGNDETITGIWLAPSPTTANQIATKSYADALSIAGVATSTESSFGGVWLGTSAQTASSTNGAPNTPYVLQTKNATDTPQSSCRTGFTSAGAGCVPTANLYGKLSQSWLDLTAAFTWTGQHTFSKTISTLSTTTQATTTSLSINGLSYQWPATQGASSTVIKTDGNGKLIWDYNSLAKTVIPASLVATTSKYTTENFSTNTTGYTELLNVPHSINVNSISVSVVSVGGAGALKIGVYSEDGQKLLFSTTTKSISAVGMDTSTLTTTYFLEKGNYYVVVVPVSTANIGLDDWVISDNLNAPTGEPVMIGTQTVTAGTLPTSFTPSSLTPSNIGARVRFDN